MSRTIDEKVVEMRFDNKNFEHNVSNTMSTLDKLKQSLKFNGASKGFEEVNAAANGVNMSGLGRAVETVQAKFSALSVIGVTALANITNSAVNAGKRIVSALTIDPIKSGFQEYETQINAVQTILANTESKGSTINDVNKALDTLNTYADKTIYNFTEMTRNIGTFTAAGVDLNTSVSAIQGIANMAAVSGSTSQQASTAMYQLSQALASGTVKLTDWNSVVSAGMGGQVFQDALKETSRQMVKNADALKKMSAEQKKAWQESHGYTDDQMKSMQEYSFNVDKIIKKNGSFRESLHAGWITADVLTATLGKMTKTGVVDYVVDMTGASKESVIELQKLGDEVGYSSDKVKELALSIANGDEELAKSVISTVKMATTAEEAATKVKTLTQLWDTLKEAAQSGWTQSWETIVGDFEEAKELYTRISDAVGSIISASADARNKVLGEGLSSGWKQFINAAEADEQLLKDSITSTAKDLGVPIDELIEKNGSFEKSLKEGWMTSDILKKSISSLAEKTKGLSDEELLNIGYTRDQANAIKDLNEKVQNGEINLDNFAKSMARVSGRENIIEGFANIFKKLGEAIKPIGEAFREVFSPVTGGQVYSFTERFRSFTEQIEISSDTIVKIKRTFKGFFSILDIGKKIVSSIFKAFAQLAGSDGISSVGDSLLSITANIGDFFTSLNESFDSGGFSGMLSKIVSGISKGLGMAVDGFKGFGKIFSSVGGAICKVAGKIWGAVTKVFGWIRENISAGDIFAGLAGGGIFMLAKKLGGLVDKIKGIFEKLFDRKQTEGLKDKFGDILDSVKESLQSFTSGIKVWSLVGIAAAVSLLSSSFRKISELDGVGIAKSLFAIGVSLAMMTKALNSMPKNSSFATKYFGMTESTNLIKSGISMIFMATAIKILSDSIVQLGGLSLKEIGKGLSAVGGGLAELCLGLKIINKVKVPLSTSVAMLALAESCKILGDAFSKFAGYSWDEIRQGLVAMGGALAELVAGILVLQKAGGIKSLFGSLGVLIVVKSLEDMAEGLKSLAEMQWDEIGKGLSAMGGALAEITIVLSALSKISKISVGGSIGGGIMGAFSNKLFGKGGASISGSGGFSAQLSGLSNLFSAGSIWIVVQGLSKLAGSLKSFGEMNWGEIGRGLTGMGVALAEVGAVTTIAGKIAGFSGILGAGAIFITIQGLDTLANGLKKFSEMQWDEIDRGLVAMGAALGEVTLCSGALGSFAGLSGILGGAAIWITVQGLDDLANALKKFGEMDWGAIARGLVAMGSALAETGLGGILNSLSWLGAIGVDKMVEPLNGLADVLMKFGEMNWDEIGRGLAAMGAAMGETAIGGLLNTFSGIGASNISEIAAPLGTLADSVKKWSGVTVPEGLGSQLGILAKGINAFTFSGLGAGALSTAAPGVGIMADSVKKWSGVIVPDGLPDKLGSLASGVNAFTFSGLGADALSTAAPGVGVMADSVKKWSDVTVPEGMQEKLEGLANGVKAFTWAWLGGESMSNAVQPLNDLAGSISAWNGVTVPEGMQEKLEGLANGVKAFTWAWLGGLSIGESVEPLKDLASSVKAWNGVDVPEGLEDDLTSLANGVKSFSFAFLGGWSIAAIDGPLKTLADSVKAWNRVSVPSDLESGLESLSSGVKSFSGITDIQSGIDSLDSIYKASSKLASVDFGSITSGLKKLCDAAKSFNGIDSSSFSSFGKNLINGIIIPITGAASKLAEVGKTIINGLAFGIMSGKAALISSVLSMITEAASKVRSQSMAFRNIGRTLATNLGTGIRSGKPSVISSVSNVTSGIATSAKNQYSSMNRAGYYLAKGLADGIKNGKYIVKIAGKTIAEAALEAAKKALDENSPSKEAYKIGAYFTKGFAIGVDDNAYISKRNASSMANGALKTVHDAIEKAGNLMDSGADTQPTIRPIVDLTEVKTGAKAVNGIFGDLQTVGIRSSLDSINVAMNGKLQNGSNDDVISAINKLGTQLESSRGDTYNFGDFTYDDGSEVADAIGTLIRYAKIGRRV